MGLFSIPRVSLLLSKSSWAFCHWCVIMIKWRRLYGIAVNSVFVFISHFDFIPGHLDRPGQDGQCLGAGPLGYHLLWFGDYMAAHMGKKAVANLGLELYAEWSVAGQETIGMRLEGEYLMKQEGQWTSVQYIVNEECLTLPGVQMSYKTRKCITVTG